ncbi:MAG: hypothetical protein WBG46_04260 [Nonlabens sp.]
MNTTASPTLMTPDEYYKYASHLIEVENRSPDEVLQALHVKGMNQEKATTLVSILHNKKNDVVYAMDDDQSSSSGAKDMIIGAAWCIGGTVATLADFGYIFWGAIIFGGAQFIKGVMSK